MGDLEAFATTYDIDTIQVAGEFSAGRLSNSSDRIDLLAANGDTIAAFWYQDSAPWPEAADGQGPSLVLKNLAEPPSLGDHWRASFHHGGTPGHPSTVPGDSNGDGRFDHRDIEFAFATGEYEDGQSMNSTWVGGVWNGDNEFTSEDFVYVLQFGHDQVG